jgi:hypothetical protein
VRKKRSVSRAANREERFGWLVPTESDCSELIGCMNGKLKITGDIFSTGIKWKAMQPTGDAGFRQQSGG